MERNYPFASDPLQLSRACSREFRIGVPNGIYEKGLLEGCRIGKPGLEFLRAPHADSQRRFRKTDVNEFNLGEEGKYPFPGAYSIGSERVNKIERGLTLKSTFESSLELP